MLEFREINYQEDILDAVSLIKKGLDENYTEAFFRWKHLDNPFGKSYGIIAVDKGKIIGLRMFMFWKFFNKKENKTLTAIRPVDTVVDDEYRGRGLFKQLTLKGLEECKGKYEVVFNTPNENSLPGYLKMGWELKKTKYFKIGIVFPSFLGKDFKNGGFPDSMNSLDIAWETLKNRTYLKWRFQDENYKIAANKGAYIIYTISNKKNLNKIMIQEVVGQKRELKELLSSLTKIENAFLIYYYANDILDKLIIFKFSRKQSVVVIKNDFSGMGNKINFSLGDLEGKL